MDGRVVHRHRVSPKLTIVKHIGTLRFHMINIFKRCTILISGCSRAHSKIEKKRETKEFSSYLCPQGKCTFLGFARQVHLVGFALAPSLIHIMFGLVLPVAPVNDRGASHPRLIVKRKTNHRNTFCTKSSF